MRRLIHWLYCERVVIAFSFFTLMCILGIYRVETIARDNRLYTCRFVNDLEQRRDAGERYIYDVLHGNRQIIPGLTVADLQRSVDTQNATLAAFEGLDC